MNKQQCHEIRMFAELQYTNDYWAYLILGYGLWDWVFILFSKYLFQKHLLNE
jgi:hypothetical protein